MAISFGIIWGLISGATTKYREILAAREKANKVKLRKGIRIWLGFKGGIMFGCIFIPVILLISYLVGVIADLPDLYLLQYQCHQGMIENNLKHFYCSYAAEIVSNTAFSFVIESALLVIISGLIGVIVALFAGKTIPKEIIPIEFINFQEVIELLMKAYSWKLAFILLLSGILIAIYRINIDDFLKLFGLFSNKVLVLVLLSPFIFFAVYSFITFLRVILILLQGRELDRRIVPNQGIKNSARNAGIAFLIGGFTSIRLVNREDASVVLIFIVLFGLVAAFPSFLACIQHFVLRLILWWNGYIPWNYARFLDYSKERKLVQRVGGRYRFIHNDLQSYFAQMEAEGEIQRTASLSDRQRFVRTLLVIVAGGTIFLGLSIWRYFAPKLQFDFYFDTGLYYLETGRYSREIGSFMFDGEIDSFNKAIDSFNKAININSANPDAYYYRGLAHYEQAIQEERLATEQEALLGQSLADVEKAVQLYQKQENQESEKNAHNLIAKIYLKRGRISYQRGDYQKAIADYDEVIRRDQNRADAYFNRALAHEKQQNYEKAIEDNIKATQINPEMASAHYNLGLYRYKQAFKQGTPVNKQEALLNQAITDFKEASKLYQKQEDKQKAQSLIQEIETYRKAVKFDFYFHNGQEERKNKNYQKAIQNLTQAISIDNNSAQAYFVRGITYHDWKKYQEAYTDYSRVIELNSKFAGAYFKRGIIQCYSLKEQQKGLADFQKAAQLFREQKNQDLYEKTQIQISRCNSSYAPFQ